MLFKHILIVGVGLIGGSFGLAARKSRLAERITGYGGTRSLVKAMSRGVIDSVEESLDDGAVCQADLVYLAAPVSGIIDFLINRGSLIKPGAIITDAGSTKREICRVARESLPETASFVGGHPMAGSHHSGVEYASANLFEGAPYAIVVDEAGRRGASIVEELVKAIGARPVFMTPEHHDREVAMMSHAPQLLSVALANAARRHACGRAPSLAGSGLRDMSRLARSEWSVWKDICETNRDEIIEALTELSNEINVMRGALDSGEFARLGEAFEYANRFARDLNEKDAGWVG